ncbi:MAG TPA: glycoside hydrolase family 47 protein [Flavisolibacter sp.]
MLFARISFFILVALGSSVPAIAQTTAFPDSLRTTMKQAVSAAARHAWNGYMQYARGMDDLQPLTKTGKNWYRHSLLMTPVDSYDTFHMLGMKKEADEAKQLIISQLDFDVDNEVQVFEITIRLLGGLISAYEMDGTPRFLQLAEDLGNRLLPAFQSATGMPYRYVHLQSGRRRDSLNNPAEIGTLMLEFGRLSQHTGDKRFFKAAKKAMMQVYARRSRIGLVGMQINVETGEWTNRTSQIGAYIDSYYEYLFKAWKMFGDRDFLKAWKVHQRAISRYLIEKTANGWFLKQADMHSGARGKTVYGALDAFYAGLCAYAGDRSSAKSIQRANYYMWTHFGMEPEAFDFTSGQVLSAYYILRPENIESCFYLYRTTGDHQYLWMGKRMFDDILKYCRTPEAFASIKDVRTMEKANSMQSFFIAETLKYAWLLFAPQTEGELSQVVFNTEAHPFLLRLKNKK